VSLFSNVREKYLDGSVTENSPSFMSVRQRSLEIEFYCAIGSDLASRPRVCLCILWLLRAHLLKQSTSGRLATLSLKMDTLWHGV
jgi:hypothetical protein